MFEVKVCYICPGYITLNSLSVGKHGIKIFYFHLKIFYLALQIFYKYCLQFTQQPVTSCSGRPGAGSFDVSGVNIEEKWDICRFKFM